MNPKPLAIRLTLEETEALELLAKKFECTAPTGQYAGQPSWRTLIREIANGKLTVSKPA